MLCPQGMGSLESLYTHTHEQKNAHAHNTLSMNFRMFILAVVTLLLANCFVGGAQAAHTTSDVTVFYRVNRYDIERGYLSNADALSELDSLINRYGMNIDSVSIIAYASPEGHFDSNVILSKRRALAMHRYLRDNYPEVNFGHVTEYAGGPDFAGLTRRVQEDMNVPYRSEVLAIVEDWGNDPDRTFARLKTLRGGAPYAYIRRHYLPWMRTATTILIHFNASVSVYDATSSTGDLFSVYVRPVESTTYDASAGDLLPVVVTEIPGSNVVNEAGSTNNSNIILPPAVIPSTGSSSNNAFITHTPNTSSEIIPSSDAQNVQSEERIDIVPQGEEEADNAPAIDMMAQERVPFIALTTNLLYESATVLAGFHTVPLTVGYEIPIGQHWSIFSDYTITTPWHAWHHNADCIELMHWDLGGKWYPGGDFLHPFQAKKDRRVLDGWYAYASAGAGYYDFERDGKGYQGEEVMASVGIGYGLVFGEHLSLSLGLGAGPLYTRYRYYEGRSNNEHLMYQYKGTWQYFGITDAKVTLTWLFYRTRNVKPQDR